MTTVEEAAGQRVEQTDRRPSLLSGPFLLVLPLTLFGCGLEAVLRTVTPLMMLDRGGTAITVGILASAYALPSLLFRPVVGYLIDSWRHGRLLRLGALGSTVLPVLLLIPGQVAMIVVRFLNGTAWVFFSVANHSLVAKLAPANRRAEASALFMSMYALAGLLGPAIGVALYTSSGELVAIAAAVVIGVGALAVALRVQAPETSRRAQQEPSPAGTDRGWLAILVEPSALPWTLLLVTSYTAYALFTIFPPVYALAVGAPVELLVVYFPIYGIGQVVSSPVFGRLADRLGRRSSIVLGCAMAGTGLVVATIPSIVTFTIAAFVFSLSQSLVNPTISALTMERAPKHRLGSAMATYTMGYQVSTGLSSLLWGALITIVGFTWVFVVAIGFQILTIALSFALIRSPGRVVQAR
jgi:MFS family permease